ncbi:MAG TPA: OsmC family protein [Bryobacteraceae bacterium]|nr:OsmC family protein [Bryobacteraceae bacterium]
MAEHKASIAWSHQRGDFLKGTYSREHTWTFDGGAVVPASPALSSVPLPYSKAANVDPEEAFIAAISSCHMLTYLYLAYRAGFDVASYEDHAVGHTELNDRGASWVSRVQLRPRIEYRGTAPTREEEDHLHHAAHEDCTIANSVATEITIARP